jgi:drug/metabolite transporter (DMT)-like permease
MPAVSARTGVRTFVLTCITMCAFAANSLLCRAALAEPAIDAMSFTAVRLISGALVLWLLTLRRARGTPDEPRDWFAVAVLCIYAIAFSVAYRSLGAGTGALILFGTVQLTMLAAGFRAGERFRPAAWVGLAAAVTGVAYLVSPGVRAPEPLGAALMAVAGVTWGLYSLRGRGSVSALLANARNFIGAVPFAALLALAAAESGHSTPRGVLLALVCGAVTSGLGYVIWYAALRGLAATQASVVQLSVPVIAAAGGLLFLAEPVTLRLGVSAAAVLGGIALVLTQRGAATDDGIRR